MSLFADPTTHAANPPETWVAAKRGDRAWVLTTADGQTVIDRFETKRAALAGRETGFMAQLYRDETRWYAGESVHGWKSYAEVTGS